MAEIEAQSEEIKEAEPKSLWEQICDEFEQEQPSLPEAYKTSLETSPSLQFTSQRCSVSLTDVTSFIHQPPSQILSEPPDPKTCSTRDYLDTYIFPILLPGMAAMLKEAYKEKCFERKRTKFVALDFLTQWLYNSNLKRKEDSFTQFFEIPFVMEWLEEHPRPPIPMSLLWSDEQAALIIQSFWRGYLVRRTPEVQELRRWQRELRENKHIYQVVKKFWSDQQHKVGKEMNNEDEEELIPNYSGVSIEVLSPTPQNLELL